MNYSSDINILVLHVIPHNLIQLKDKLLLLYNQNVKIIRSCNPNSVAKLIKISNSEVYCVIRTIKKVQIGEYVRIPFDW